MSEDLVMNQLQIQTTQLFAPAHTLAWPYLAKTTYPWEILGDLKKIILHIGEQLDPADYHQPSEEVWIANTAQVSPTASIAPPAIIGARTHVRHGALIRGGVLVGDDCVVGNSVELKNCVLFDRVQVPHFKYVGDSLLGYKAHLGAGAVTSNVKSDRSLVCVKGEGLCLQTGLFKLGAMLGDGVEVGCNAVLTPGCVVGQKSMVYPTTLVRGVIPPRHILKAGRGVVLCPMESTNRP